MRKPNEFRSLLGLFYEVFHLTDNRDAFADTRDTFAEFGDAFAKSPIGFADLGVSFQLVEEDIANKVVV